MLTGLATLTRPNSAGYTDAQGTIQSAGPNQPADDYNPVDLTYRGQKMGRNAQLTLQTSGLQARGQLQYSEEPATLDDRRVYRLHDASGANAIELDVAGGRYVFTLLRNSLSVAVLDTGIAPELQERKQILLSYAPHAFHAAASEGAVVADTQDLAPENLNTWTVGEPGPHSGQCWIYRLRYLPEATADLQPQTKVHVLANQAEAEEYDHAVLLAGQANQLPPMPQYNP